MPGPPWKILRIVSKGDYNYAVVPDHPYATKNGYVLEHRIVVENQIGRLLTPEEIVHHDNEQKKDNVPSNLIITTQAKHAKHHLATGRTIVRLKCPWCSNIFERERCATHIVKKKNSYTCCSASCRGSLSRSIQLGREPADLERRLAQNILSP